MDVTLVGHLSSSIETGAAVPRATRGPGRRNSMRARS